MELSVNGINVVEHPGETLNVETGLCEILIGCDTVLTHPDDAVTVKDALYTPVDA